MGYLGRVSPGAADPQPQIKKTGGSAGCQSSICWYAKRTRQVCTLKPGAVKRSALAQDPREQLSSRACPKGQKNLHELELAALSVASASTKRGSTKEPRGARRKPGHFP